MDINLEDNGAVEVDEATEVPIKVFLGGPIKYWWGTNRDGTKIWGSPEHQAYMKWRDAVRIAIVSTGFCVTYSPHRAIQGAWHKDLQKVNDAAIMYSDLMVVVTPWDVEAKGTEEEAKLAKKYDIPVWGFPPGHSYELRQLTRLLKEFKEERDLHPSS